MSRARAAPSAGRWRLFALLLALGWVAVPIPALAHGIGADASDKSIAEFIPLGIEHMLLGWDHLLFIAGVVLLAWKVGRAAKLITAFVVGHSTTLLLATLAGWRVNPTAIDAVIGLSVLFVGVVGVYGRPRSWGWFYLVVLGFGLLHGVGLSTRLQDLGLPKDGLLGRVIAFNVGVEIGQLAAIAAMVGLARVAGSALRHDRVQKGIFVVLGIVGMTSAATFAGLAAVEIMNGQGATAVASPTESCTVSKRTVGFTLGGGGHPSKDFYDPQDTLPDKDFAHVIGDGYVILLYQPSLPAAEVSALRAYVTQPHKIVGGPKFDQDVPLRALNAFDMLTCTRFDLDAVKTFATTWLNDPRSRSPE